MSFTPTDFSGPLMQAKEKLKYIENPGFLSLRENLQVRLEKAEQEVERVKELLQLLDSNPDIQRILELLGR